MGALSVHTLTLRVHELTSQLDDKKKVQNLDELNATIRNDASYAEIRKTLIAAYHELGTAASELAEKKAKQQATALR